MSVINSWGNGFAIASSNVEPIKTPSGLLATRAVETKQGWISQIIVDKEIIWESEPVVHDDDDDDRVEPQAKAIRVANEKIVSKLKELFS